MKTAAIVRIAFILVIAALIAVPLASAADDAAALYKTKCVACHGADGAGSAMGAKMGARPLASADVQKQSDVELTSAIAKGKNKMPAYAGKLTDDQIKGLVTYMRTFKK